MSTYTLPDLPYDYAALEPHISAEIMELHHSKHHKAYVDGANTALEKLAAARDSGDFGTVPMLEKNLAFNLGGHTNHSVFWQNMSPEGGDRPDGEVAAMIDQHFGSFEGFKGQFEAAGTTIQGSGWAVLSWDSIAQKPLVFQLWDQQGNVPIGQTPLLMLDMWEHAFYLQYKNVKADYVSAWWNVVNWSDVSQRLERARSATSGLIVAS
ncbi:superoxide dismutase [Ornithinimicrobium sp. CNJ-824]|uniref:superoxide dismutase n=1 Tax=Ornithinimicrobium sp. CNJ-824 TaxID=1904966 RepID=UPI00095B3E1A|nr:superoxide dismutase [Ornithinimicrobium sp. CNJ-824]OLT21436.1 superoxide dismutase [Ornithinimicrobium sp. CNJ-824]